MTVIGADVEALRRLAEHMNAAASTIDNEILPRLNDAIEHTPWHGFDADDFRQYWSNAGAHLLHRTSSDLAAAADRVRANADEQEAASDSNGGGVVGGVGAADAGADGAGSHATGQPHASGLTSSPADGTKYDGGFTVGQPPERRIGHDNSFPWGSKKGQDTPGDHLSWAKWGGHPAWGRVASSRP